MTKKFAYTCVCFFFYFFLYSLLFSERKKFIYKNWSEKSKINHKSQEFFSNKNNIFNYIFVITAINQFFPSDGAINYKKSNAKLNTFLKKKNKKLNYKINLKKKKKNRRVLIWKKSWIISNRCKIYGSSHCHEIE